MKDTRHKKLFSKSLRQTTILMFIILLLFTILVIIVKSWVYGYSWSKFFDDLFNSLVGAILPILFFNMVYEYLNKHHQDQVISETIAETIAARNDIIDRLTPETKITFIKNCAQSLVGRAEGDMLFSTLLTPYLSNKYSFRRNFKYFIFYMDHLDEPLPENAPASFPLEKYAWVVEELSFDKKIKITEQGLSVGFSFNEKKLESFFRDEHIVFRENLWLDQQAITQIAGLTEEELQLFVEMTLQFELSIDDQSFICQSVRRDEDSGFVVHFNPPAGFLKDGEQEVRLKLRFRMPQLRLKKQFLVILSEPVRHVDILFSNQMKGVKVTGVPFFDQKETVSCMPNNITKIELNDWVLPKSGILFVWEDGEPVRTE